MCCPGITRNTFASWVAYQCKRCRKWHHVGHKQWSGIWRDGSTQYRNHPKRGPWSCWLYCSYPCLVISSKLVEVICPRYPSLHSRTEAYQACPIYRSTGSFSLTSRILARILRIQVCQGSTGSQPKHKMVSNPWKYFSRMWSKCSLVQCMASYRNLW